MNVVATMTEVSESWTRALPQTNPINDLDEQRQIGSAPVDKTSALSPSQKAWLSWMGAGLTAAIAFSPISSLIFAVLGLVPDHPQWHLTFILGIFLGLSGLRLSLPPQANTRFSIRSPLLSPGQICLISDVAGGALLGFFYGGSWSNNQLRWAIVGLISLAIIWPTVLRILSRNRSYMSQPAALILSLLAASGLTFWMGAWGLAAWTASQWSHCFFYGGLALTYGALSWAGLQQLWFLHRQT